MGRFVLRRLLASLPTLFVIVTLAFFMIRLAPGGPFELERPLDPKVMEISTGFIIWIAQFSNSTCLICWLCCGGISAPLSSIGISASPKIFANGLPVSLRIGALALALAALLGGAAGVWAAFNQNRWGDVAVISAATFGITIPSFVLAPLLQILFGLTLGWLPVGGWNDGALRNVVMPVLTLALPQVAIIARLIRAAMIEALRANPIRTLRAQGLSNITIALHALRAAMLPVVSYLGPAAAQVLTGSLVVESIFGLPGVGRYFIEGALSRDYTLVMGTVVMIAVFVLFFNLLVDILYALLDPRVRHD